MPRPVRSIVFGKIRQFPAGIILAENVDEVAAESRITDLTLVGVLEGLLFGKTRPEILYEEATLAKVPVSLATVYNTLNRPAEAGLLRRVSVDGTKTYFDTNVTSHRHFYLEDNHELINIPDQNLMLQQMPEVPEGYEIVRVDMVVRLCKKR